MISANGGLPAHRYTPLVTPRWPRGSEPASTPFSERCYRSEVIEERTGGPQWAPKPPPPLSQTKMPREIHYGATAANKWTNTSLTSKEMFLFFR